MKPLNYRDYHEWLFPRDQIIHANPLDTDASTNEIIAEVSCQTGIPEKWLKRSTREVMEGLAGLGCLWFLHGANGEVQGVIKTPEWVNPVLSHLFTLIRDSEESRGADRVFVHETNWLKGTVTFEKRYKKRKPTRQTFRIGKYIDKYAAAHNRTERERLAMHHDLKWRSKADVYEWKISCHPYDVLTMSFDRSWPSCMKPGGLFEHGPLTDMASGSAIIWFTKPGADAPCGRFILRPFVDHFSDTPAIASGGRLYGEGPRASTSSLNSMLEPWLQGLKVKRVLLCPLGIQGRALTRGIYSDTDQVISGCKQTLDGYADAYKNLGEAEWPAATFAVKDLTEAAQNKGDDYEYRQLRGEGEGEENEVDEAMARLLECGTNDITDWYLSDATLTAIYEDISGSETSLRYAVDQYVDYLLTNDPFDDYHAIIEAGEPLPGEIYDDLYDVLWTSLVQFLNDETETMDIFTASTSQTSALSRIFSKAAHPALITSYAPRDLANAEVQHAWGDKKWHRIWEDDKLENFFNIIVDDDRYIDADSGEVVDQVFFLPDWYLSETSSLHNALSNASFLANETVSASDTAYLDPPPLAWLLDLVDQAG